MKFKLDSILGGFNLSAINARLKQIETEFNDRVLYRNNPKGEANQMVNDLDMNGYKILNAKGILVEGVPIPSDEPPRANGAIANPGVSDLYSRADHIHTGMVGPAGPAGISTGIVYAYKRGITVPGDRPGLVVYDFSTAKIVVPASDDIGNGWTKTIPTGADPLYITAASAASGETSTDEINSNEWTTPVLWAQGGLNSASVFIYRRTTFATPPDRPTVDTVYTFANGLLANLNNGWTRTIPDVVQGPYLWVSTATVASSLASDVVTPNEWALPQILAQKGENGTPGANGGISSAVVFAYIRSTATPTSTPGDVTYTFSEGRITSPDTLANSWSKTIPSGLDPLWVVSSSASSSFATDTIASNEWSSPVKLAENGVNGLNTATIYIYRRTTTETVPTGPTGTTTYDFTSRSITGMGNNWSSTIPPNNLGQYLWVTTATASSLTNTDTIATTEWAAPSLLSKNGADGTSGTNGSNGQRGNVNVAIAVSGTVWSNTEANTAISAAGYGSPQNRDIVTQYNIPAGFSESRFRDGTTWIKLDAYIDGNLLVNGTLSANKLTGGTISGVSINIGNGYFRVASNGTGGANTTAVNLTSANININNITNPGNPPLEVTNYDGNRAATTVTNLGRQAGAHGIRSSSYIGSSSSIATGLVGCNAGFDFYAEGAGANYGPFTGAHDCLLPNGTFVTPGDIVVDVKVVSKTTLSNTLCEVAPSSEACQKGAVGVFLLKQGTLYGKSCAGLKDGTACHAENASKYQLAIMNALGEGQVNVCGENGDIEIGDLIVTSNVPGKGMKQDDDIIRSYTVARAREAYKFKSPDDRATIACIYLCG